MVDMCKCSRETSCPHIHVTYFYSTARCNIRSFLTHISFIYLLT